MPRCAHQNGCLIEFFLGQGLYFVSEGQISGNSSKDMPNGQWGFNCDDCNLTWRGFKMDAPQWLKRYIAAQEEKAAEGD